MRCRWAMTLRRGCAVLVAVGVLLATSGCAGIVNPHLTWAPDAPADSINLDQALRYADGAKKAYRDALGNQAKLASWLGIGLIPLMAASAGLGITGGPPAAVAATALTGAAGYGVGVWLY